MHSILDPVQDREKIIQNTEFIKEFMPELLPVIKQLHNLGMISGMRNITYAGEALKECCPKSGYMVHTEDLFDDKGFLLHRTKARSRKG
jgi:hypothetical protein